VADRQRLRAGQIALVRGNRQQSRDQFRAVLGDAAAACRNADYIRRETFRVQRHMALPMETRGLLAQWDAAGGRLTVNGAAKVLFFNRRTLAKQMGLAEDAIDMVENDVGGGFGARGEFYPEDFLIRSRPAMSGGRKWIEDRREQLMTSVMRASMECDIEIACRRDGHILALRGACLFRRWRLICAQRRHQRPQCRAIHVRALSHPRHRYPMCRLAQLTNKTPVEPIEVPALRDRFLSRTAHRHGGTGSRHRSRRISPAAISCRKRDAYAIATITPFESKTSWATAAIIRSLLDRVLAEIGWSEKARLQGQLIEGRYHGLALGCFVEGGAAGQRERAAGCLVYKRRSFTSMWAHRRSGQGLENAYLPQIAADALEIPMERIRGVFHGSTSCVSDGYGAYHSRSVVMGGSASWRPQPACAMPSGPAPRSAWMRAAEVALLDGGRRAPRAAPSRWPGSRTPPSRSRAASSTRSIPMRMGPMRPMWRSISSSDTWRSSTTWRSRIAVASSIDDAVRAGDRRRWCRGWAAPSWRIWSMTSTVSFLTARSPITWCPRPATFPTSAPWSWNRTLADQPARRQGAGEGGIIPVAG